MKIKIIDQRLLADHYFPKYATLGAAGIDLRACLTKGGVILHQDETLQVPAGFALQIPKNHVGLTIPRSSSGVRGLALRNTVGVIDSDYRGEIQMTLVNKSTEPFVIQPMDRIAQLVIMPIWVPPYLEPVDELDPTDRGTGGFGSTGKS